MPVTDQTQREARPMNRIAWADPAGRRTLRRRHDRRSAQPVAAGVQEGDGALGPAHVDGARGHHVLVVVHPALVRRRRRPRSGNVVLVGRRGDGDDRLGVVGPGHVVLGAARSDRAVRPGRRRLSPRGRAGRQPDGRRRKASGVAWFTIGGNLGFAIGPLLVALFVPLLDERTTLVFLVPGAVACTLLLANHGRVALPIIASHTTLETLRDAPTCGAWCSWSARSACARGSSSG